MRTGPPSPTCSRGPLDVGLNATLLHPPLLSLDGTLLPAIRLFTCANIDDVILFEGPLLENVSERRHVVQLLLFVRPF